MKKLTLSLILILSLLTSGLSSSTLLAQSRECITIAEITVNIPGLPTPRYLGQPELGVFVKAFTESYLAQGYAPRVPEMDRAAFYVGDANVLFVALKGECLVGQAVITKQEFNEFLSKIGKGVTFRD